MFDLQQSHLISAIVIIVITVINIIIISSIADAGLASVVPPLKSQPLPSGRVCIPYSPQCGSVEKVNLISK